MNEHAKIMIGMLVLASVVLAGCTASVGSCEDQSRTQLERCNTDCGEGIGAELCKTNCTAEHNSRLEQCQETR